MVTETVTVRFVEQGARVIKRRIDDMGMAADRATRGIFLLKRALFVLGGAGIVRGLVGYVDALTEVENRLLLTSSSTANLEAVQERLLDVAIRSRSNWQATADVYSRIALSTRQLGVGQQQVLDVTETLTKASILSGASAREANAALIQLGQGLASDRLSGDELRSVLEQLPFVADMIVNFLNDTNQLSTGTQRQIEDLNALARAGLLTTEQFTRGTLRALGSAGKLTSEITFRAIEAGKDNVDRLFAETDITISQAIENLRSRFARLLDNFEDTFNASLRVALAIDNLSKGLDILTFALATAAIAGAAVFTASMLASIAMFAVKLKIAGGALARLRAIQASYATSQAASTAITAANTRAQITNLAAINTRSAAQVVSARLEYASATAAFQNGRARDLLTGKFIANAAARDRLTAASIRLANAERVNLGLTSSLTAARTASIAADNAAAAAAARAAAADAARSGILARLSARFPLLAGAARLAAGAVSALFAILVANPIGALVISIALATAAIFTFGNRIKVTEDGVVGLKDATIAAFQLIMEFISPVTDFMRDAFGTALTFIMKAFRTAFSTILSIVGETIKNVINIITFLPRVMIGVIAGINAAWGSLPAAAGVAIDALVDIFVTGFENLANIGINAINSIIRALNGLAGTRVGDILGLSALDEIDLADFSDLRTNLGEGGQSAADAFTDAFTSSLESTRIENVLAGFGDAVIERARANLAAAELEAGIVTDVPTPPGADPASGDPAGSGSGGGNSADFAEELAALQRRIDLERQWGLQKEITNNILSVEKALKRELTTTEKEQISTATRLIEISKIQGEILQDVLGPQETLKLTQSALNDLFAQGAINLAQYNTRLRETQIAADRASETLGGGFRAAIASAIQSTGQFGEALGDWVVGAANNASDAIVEFAKTGKFNIRQFFGELFAQLLKLAAQRLLMNFLGGFLGIPVGFSQGGSILPSFATGGSILPTGPGSTDSQLVAFNKRPDERVDILTPGQQAAQRNNSGGSGLTIGTIDARGAQQGVAEQIVVAIQRATPSIVKQSVAAGRSASKRGS